MSRRQRPRQRKLTSRIHRRIETIVGLFLVLLSAAHASAQAVAGGAFIVSRLPREPYIPGAFAVPPNGLTSGIAVFGGARVAPRLGVQGELSIPGELETVVVSLHPRTTFDDVTAHRDTILSGVVSVRAASWCELVAGGGLTFERTTVTESITEQFTGATTVQTQSLSATRATFTAGVDLPIPIGRHVALLPTGRIHVIARDSPEPGIDARPLSPPSKYSFRLGVGARVEF